MSSQGKFAVQLIEASITKEPILMIHASDQYLKKQLIRQAAVDQSWINKRLATCTTKRRYWPNINSIKIWHKRTHKSIR